MQKDKYKIVLPKNTILKKAITYQICDRCKKKIYKDTIYVFVKNTLLKSKNYCFVCAIIKKIIKVKKGN